MRRAAALLLAIALASASAHAGASDASKRSAAPNRFGALAYHRDSGAWGASYDFVQARAARVEALRQCAHPR